MAGCAEGCSSCPTSQTQTLKFYSVTTISYYSIEALRPKHHWSLPGLHRLQAPAVSLWLSLCLSASVFLCLSQSLSCSLTCHPKPGPSDQLCHLLFLTLRDPPPKAFLHIFCLEYLHICLNSVTIYVLHLYYQAGECRKIK